MITRPGVDRFPYDAVAGRYFPNWRFLPVCASSQFGCLNAGKPEEYPSVSLFRIIGGMNDVGRGSAVNDAAINQ